MLCLKTDSYRLNLIQFHIFFIIITKVVIESKYGYQIYKLLIYNNYSIHYSKCQSMITPYCLLYYVGHWPLHDMYLNRTACHFKISFCFNHHAKLISGNYFWVSLNRANLCPKCAWHIPETTTPTTKIISNGIYLFITVLCDWVSHTKFVMYIGLPWLWKSFICIFSSWLQVCWC